MFAKLEETVILNKNLSGEAIRLYALMLIRGHKEGKCKYKIDTLAKALGWGRSKVKTLLSALTDNNLIIKHKGRGASSYELRGVENQPPDGRNSTPPDFIDYIDLKDFFKKKTGVPVTRPATPFSNEEKEREEKEEKENEKEEEEKEIKRKAEEEIGRGGKSYSELGKTDDEELKATELARKKLAEEVMDYFNLVTDSHYPYKNYYMKFIVERIYNNWVTMIEFKKVIDGKTRKWKGDRKMKQYLKPSVLFSSNNFGGYLSEFDKINSVR